MQATPSLFSSMRPGDEARDTVAREPFVYRHYISLESWQPVCCMRLSTHVHWCHSLYRYNGTSHSHGAGSLDTVMYIAHTDVIRVHFTISALKGESRNLRSRRLYVQVYKFFNGNSLTHTQWRIQGGCSGCSSTHFC